jgi:isopenicillin N synthase-like dioxygenase
MSLQNIPVIDIEHLHDARTLQSLEMACREWGFFQVVNHGIAESTVTRLMHEARLFFAQPIAVKRAITRTAENPWGFYDRELTKNTRDWKQIYDYGPPDGVMQPQWPHAMPEFRSAVFEYYGACERLAFRLLGAVAANLGAKSTDLSRAFRPAHTSFLRLNYYPKCPTPERPEGIETPQQGHLGLNHHTDAGALTILLQDRQPGLEVMRDGKWYLVEPRQDAFVINIGDIVQVWSNDRYVAALHRVIANADAERFSVPFFFSPAYSAQYAPLPSTVDAAHPAAYRPINWGEFYRGRAAGDYADLGEEIQISHFRVQ